MQHSGGWGGGKGSGLPDLREGSDWHAVTNNFLKQWCKTETVYIIMRHVKICSFVMKLWPDRLDCGPSQGLGD